MRFRFRKAIVLSLSILFLNPCLQAQVEPESYSENLDESEKQRLLQLAYQYAPIRYFHKKEQYFPTDFEAQLPYLSLYTSNSKNPYMKDLNVENFTKFVQENKDTKNYKLRIRAEFEKKARAGNLKTAKCYSNPHKVMRNGKRYIEIPYAFYYGYNGTPRSDNVLYDSLVQKFDTHYHEGDWEHITVVLHENGNLYGIYYACHGTQEARFYKKEGNFSKINRDDGYKLKDGRPVVFSALETHASYNRIGSMTRRLKPRGEYPAIFYKVVGELYIVPSDKTGSKYSLDCREEGRLETFNLEWQKTWMPFQGKYAKEGGPHGPGPQRYWSKQESIPGKYFK